MITQKKQALKRFTYICLSLSSIVISSEVQARNKVSKDWIDHPVNGGHIPVPWIGKNITEELEGPNLIGPHSKIFKHSEGKIQKDLKSPPMGEERQNSSHQCTRFKNEMIDKYEKQRPELARFKNSSRSKPHAPGLAAQARQFYLLSEDLKKEEEENNKKVSAMGKDVVGITGTLAEAVIKQKVKNEETRNILVSFKDDIKEKLMSFFN